MRGVTLAAAALAVLDPDWVEQAQKGKAPPRVFRSRLKDTADKIHDTDCRARAANVRRGLAKLPKRKRAR